MKILQKRRMRLLDLNTEDHVLDYLLQEDIITQDEYDEVTHERTQKDRAKKLLGLLPRKGRRAFGEFLQGLRGSDAAIHHELAELLGVDAADGGAAAGGSATAARGPRGMLLLFNFFLCSYFQNSY